MEVPSIHLTDVDAAREVFRRAYGDISVDVLDAPRFAWQVRVVDMGPIQMALSACQGDVILRGTPSHYVFHLPRQGRFRAAMREQRAETAEGRSAALFSPTGSVEMTNGGDSAGTIVRIDPGFLVAQLEALTGEAAQRPLELALNVRTDAGTGAGLSRLCHFMLAEIERGSDGLTHPAVMSSLCEALARALLTGQRRDLTHEKPAPASGLTVVRLVEEYLEAHAAEPLRMSELSSLTGAGVASIEAAFREHRRSTPAAFLREKRLELARRRLLAAKADQTITQIAHDAGFLRRSRFDAAYLARFEESPTQTRRRVLPTLALPAASEVQEARLASLSLREREVCAGVVRGLLNKQIAAELGISEATVKQHRARATRKLGVTSAVELTRFLRE